MKFKMSILLLFVFFLFFANATETKAMNTGFSVEELSREEKDNFLSNTSISLLQTMPSRKSIQCFDVNDKEMIAIGQENIFKKQICVYSASGDFLYGYEFNSHGSFAVEWDEDVLNIYFSRGNFIVSVNKDGEVSDIKKVADTTANNSYINDLLYSTSKVRGDKEYILQNNIGSFLDFFASSYSQLVVKDSNGETNIVYDVNSTMLFYMITKTVITIFFVSTVIIFIMQKSRKAIKPAND